MCTGRTDEASALASRIGRIIQRRNSAHLRRTGKADVKHTWQKIREITGRQNHSSGAPPDVTADLLNQHYASVSTDKSYHASSRATSLRAISDFQVFCVLDRLHHTTTGLDRIPAWFLRLGALLFSEPLAKLFNLSLATAVVPTEWKGAFITPVTKVTHPSALSDYRPTSITSVLSRVMERIVARSYIYPAFNSPPPSIHLSD